MIWNTGYCWIEEREVVWARCRALAGLSKMEGVMQIIIGFISICKRETKEYSILVYGEKL